MSLHDLLGRPPPRTLTPIGWTVLSFCLMAIGGILAWVLASYPLELFAWWPGVFLLFLGRIIAARRLGLDSETPRVRRGWADWLFYLIPLVGLSIALFVFDINGHWYGVYATAWILAIELLDRNKVRKLRRLAGPQAYQL